jgi:hypothetical protein
MRRQTWLVLVLAVSLVAAIGAQRRSDPDAWRLYVASLDPDTIVSIRTKDGRRMNATVIESFTDRVVVQPRTRLTLPPREIPYTDIESIERVKQGRSPGVKVLTWAGVGVGVSLAVVGIAILVAFS